MKKTFKTFSAFALIATLFTVAFAAVSFDPATGIGFVGKGDVQLTLGLNNKEVQTTPVTFSYVSSNVTVSEVSWECTNSKNEKVQDRARTTTFTTSITGVFSSAARVKNQITGYNLTGFLSKSENSTSQTEGNVLNSCPNDNGNWSLTTPAGMPDIISDVDNGGGLLINGVPVKEAPAL